MLIIIFKIVLIFLFIKKQEVYDWAGSQDDVPLHFTLQRGKEVVRHSDSLEQDEVLDLAERVSGTKIVSERDWNQKCCHGYVILCSILHLSQGLLLMPKLNNHRCYNFRYTLFSVFVIHHQAEPLMMSPIWQLA